MAAVPPRGFLMGKPLLCIYLVGCLGTVASQGLHWGAIFPTGDSWYTLQLQKNSQTGMYANTTAGLVVLLAEDGRSVEELLVDAQGVYGGASETRAAGGTLLPSSSSWYSLLLDSRTWLSPFFINTTTAIRIALFSDVPFHTFGSATTPYFVNVTGGRVAPTETLDDYSSTPTGAGPNQQQPPQTESATNGAKWAESLGAAALLISTTVISNSVLAVFSPTIGFYRDCAEAFVLSIAAGALLGTACYVYFFQSANIITLRFPGSVDVVWRWATMLLSGFIAPIVLHLIASFLIDAGACAGCAATDTRPTSTSNRDMNLSVHSAAVDPKDVRVIVDGNTVRLRLISKVVISDVLHRLADGFSIAGAFIVCHTNFGWLITITAIVHELFQEISDYFTLTNPRSCKVKPLMALLFNVVASLAVVVGVCATNAAERMTNEEFGYIAAFAAGIYVHVATWDSLPRVYTLVHTPLLRAACLLCFIIGVVAVASLLADYDECGPIDGNVIPPAFQQILDQILGTQQQQQQQP